MGGPLPQTWHVELFEAPFTPELWASYEKVTRSYGCTREFTEHFERPVGATLAFVRSEGEEAAFMYRIHAEGSARVLGRFTAPSAGALGAFADAVFARHPGVRIVRTGLVDALPDVRVIGRPALTVREDVELRIALPSSVAEYERRLGKRFLSRARYYERLLARERPAARLTVHERDEIPRALVAEVVRLNRERVAAKGARSVFDEGYEEGISRVARAHGLAVILRDEDRVCAGAIDIHCGSEAFSWVVGYDATYARYHPGRLCDLEAVRRAIERGIRTYHLLHGDSRHKRDLGGQPARLASYAILRSWSAARPADVGRTCGVHIARLARRLIARADRWMARGYGRTPLKALARAIARPLRAR